MSAPEDIRINALVQFPAQITASAPATIAKNNGVWSVSLSFDPVSAGLSSSPATDFRLVWNSLTKSFYKTAINGAPLYSPAPTTQTGNYAMAVADASIIFNAGATATLTLLNPVTYPGRWLMVKTVAAQLVNSASANVVPLIGGAAGTAILAASAGKWALLQSDGANWIVMAAN